VGLGPVCETSAPATGGDLLERSQRSIAQRVDSELVRSLTNWFTGGRDTEQLDPGEPVEDRGGDGTFDPLPAGLRTLDVMQLSLESLQKVVTRYRLAGYPPDLLITIPRNSCRALDFHRAEEMIALGRKHTIEALDRATAEG
ncbi:MAG: esterase, partial [Nitriliruptoraceae bacterium]